MGKSPTTARQARGRKIRAQMALCGLTQQELADRVPCSQQSISKYVAGVTIPTAARQERIAEILGTSTSRLFGTDARRVAS